MHKPERSISDPHFRLRKRLYLLAHAIGLKGHSSKAIRYWGDQSPGGHSSPQVVADSQSTLCLHFGYRVLQTIGENVCALLSTINDATHDIFSGN